MPGTLFQLPKPIAWDAGAVVPGGKLNFYQTGTSTPQNTYTDEALSVAHSNPVVADAEGVFAPIYLDPALPDYRVTFTDSSDVTIYQVDDVPASPDLGPNATIQSTEPYLVLYETDAAANNGKFRLIATGEALKLQLGNDALDTFTDIITVERSANTIDDATLGTKKLATFESGSFTGTLTGYASGPTGTVNYRIYGDIATGRVLCTLTIANFISGTSNSAAMTMTGLPSACQPANASFVPSVVYDNTGSEMGAANVSGGVITFYMGSPLNASGFTASGTKGLNPGWTITYDLT